MPVIQCRKSIQYNENLINESNKFILKKIALKFNFQTRMKTFNDLIVNPATVAFSTRQVITFQYRYLNSIQSQ